PPSATMPAAVASAAAASRSAINSAAPAPARPRAMAVPSAPPPPVTMATLPSTRKRASPASRAAGGMLLPPWRAAGLVEGAAAFDVDRLTGHVAGLVGGQPGDQVGNVVRALEAAERDLAERLGLELAGRLAEAGAALAVDLVPHVGVDRARAV